MFLEILKDQYLTPVEMSDGIEIGQAGLNEDILSGTDMMPYFSRVFIQKFDHPNRPIFFQNMYQIVPLDFPGDKVIMNDRRFKTGDMVVINDVLRRLL